jgi:hypothetical protein
MTEGSRRLQASHLFRDAEPKILMADGSGPLTQPQTDVNSAPAGP